MTKLSKGESRLRQRKSVFIVEDHPVFREGLVQIINREADLLVGGQASTAEEGLRDIIGGKPDVALVDINLPGKSGLELIRSLRKVDSQIKILVVSMHEEALYADRVLRAGGDGYVMKDEDPSEIVHAIHAMLNGHLHVSEKVFESGRKAGVKKLTAAKARPLDRLTDTQLMILELLAQHQSQKAIAQELHLSGRSVESQCVQIKRAWGLKSHSELVRRAELSVKRA